MDGSVCACVCVRACVRAREKACDCVCACVCACGEKYKNDKIRYGRFNGGTDEQVLLLLVWRNYIQEWFPFYISDTVCLQLSQGKCFEDDVHHHHSCGLVRNGFY